MLKVLFLGPPLYERNGYARYSHEILRRLPRYGIEPILATSSRALVQAPEYEQMSVIPKLRSEADSFMKSLGIWHDVCALKGALKASLGGSLKDVRGIHVLMEPYMPLGDRLARALHLKLTATAVGTYAVASLNGPFGPKYRNAWDHCERIISISRYTQSRFLQAMPHLNAKAMAIPLGTSPAVDQRPEAHDPLRREKAFLAVGALKARKGMLLTIAALKSVVADMPQVKLYLIGSASSGAHPQYAHEVQELIAQSGLAQNVVLLGELSDAELATYYQRVRALVMPSINVGSHFEGFGLVHLEANAYGTPSIGSRDSGNEDAVADEKSGYLIAQNDVAELSRRMLSLLQDDSTWIRLSQGATDHALAMSWDITAQAYAEELKTAFGK